MEYEYINAGQSVLVSTTGEPARALAKVKGIVITIEEKEMRLQKGRAECAEDSRHEIAHGGRRAQRGDSRGNIVAENSKYKHGNVRKSRELGAESCRAVCHPNTQAHARKGDGNPATVSKIDTKNIFLHENPPKGGDIRPENTTDRDHRFRINIIREFGGTISGDNIGDEVIILLIYNSIVIAWILSRNRPRKDANRVAPPARPAFPPRRTQP